VVVAGFAYLLVLPFADAGVTINVTVVSATAARESIEI
jgi:hypothetical protein